VCETMSVTWRFLQPFLKRFSRGPICVINLFKFTFSTAVNRYGRTGTSSYLRINARVGCLNHKVRRGTKFSFFFFFFRSTGKL
jgi:hypothetical protein